MKKASCAMLCLAMLACLAACGGQAASQPAGSSTAPTEAPTAAPTTVPTTAPTPTPEPTLPPVAGQVLLEQDGLTITAQSVTFSTGFDPGELAVRLENSSGSAIRVQLGNLMVNGNMFSSEMDVEVPASGTVDASIPIRTLDMYNAGLPDAAQMDLDFVLTAGGSTATTDICHLDIPGGNTRMPTALKETVYADDLVRIGCQYFNIKNQELEVKLQNVSGRYLTVKPTSLSLNGEGIPLDGEEQVLMPGAFANFHLYLSQMSSQLYEAMDAMAMEPDATLPVEAGFLILDTATGEQLADTGVLPFEVGFSA